jgi:hypothetical protein
LPRRSSKPEQPPTPGQDEESVPNLIDQFGRTRKALIGLISAHFRLLSAELSEIMDEIKRALALIAGAAVLVVLAIVMVGVGTLLWLGEWAFGSMGWGVLHGTALLLTMAVVAVLINLPNSGPRLGAAFAVSLLVGVVIGVIFWVRLTNQAWGWVGDSFFAGLAWPDGSAISAADRPVIVAALVLAVLSAVVGGLVAFAAGEGLLGRLGDGLGGVLVGAIVGGLLGGLTGVPMSWGCAFGTGLAVFLILMPILALVLVLPEADWDGLKKRLTPSQTVETTKETIEWVREQMPLGPKS